MPLWHDNSCLFCIPQSWGAIKHQLVIIMKTLFLIFIILLSSSAYSAELANEVCPVSLDEFAEADISLLHEGKQINLCCNKCRRKFLKTPDKYLRNLSAEAQLLYKNTINKTASEAAHKHEKNATVHGHSAEKSDDHHDSNSSEKHDHSKHTEKSLGSFLERFHPIVVHFPIGLLLMAALSELLFILTKRSFFENASSFMIFSGALAALVAVGLGWLAASGANYSGEMAELLSRHKWLGSSTAILAFLSALFKGLSLKKQSPKLILSYRACLLLTAVLVGLTGHLGGMLIYGKDYFSW